MEEKIYCSHRGSVIWTDDTYGDEYTTLCSSCYHNHYTRCTCCDALLHEDDAYHLDGYTCDEIEDMLADHDLLRETLQMVKCEDSDSLYEQIYGCAY